MSFSDTIFLFFLALILFGPKKLPEMARKAGRLMAELRRASNEFRSQIETEIAHLEVEKSKAEMAPSPAPPGSVASVSSTPAIDAALPEPANTLAGPAAESISQIANSDAADQGAVAAISSAPASTETAPVAQVPASQESHV